MEARYQRCIELTRYFYPVKERPDFVLCNQLHNAERILEEYVARPLEPFQRDALLCLISDIQNKYACCPNHPFIDSILLKALNKGMFQIACAEFYSFCYVGDRVETRAWNKRKAETFLFCRGQLLFPS